MYKFLIIILIISLGYLIPEFINATAYVIDIVMWTSVIFLFLYSIISGIIFSKRIFACLNCGYNFNPKWYLLAVCPWRSRRRYRVYKELSTGECEKVNLKCPECKANDCVMK